MSRQFDGVDDVVTFDPGDATFPQGPITVAALIKPTNVGSTRAIVEGNTATDAGYGLLIDSGDYYCERQFTSPQGASVNDWQWAVFSKATGSAPPRWHFRNVTDGGAWIHGDAASNSSNGPSPVTHIRVGQAEFFTGRFAGSIAAIAVWGTALADGDVETACTLAATDLADAAPAWGTLWGQASEATAVDDFTGGGGDQAAIVGTAVDPDDPPGFDYALTPPAAEVTLTAATLTLTAVPVTPVPGPVTVTLTPASLTLTAIAVSPAPVAVTVTLTPAAITLAAVALTATPGPVTVTLTPAVITLLAVALGLGAIQEPGTLVASGRPASTLTPSGSTHTLTASGRP